jgi:hypothetical protein
MQGRECFPCYLRRRPSLAGARRMATACEQKAAQAPSCLGSDGGLCPPLVSGQRPLGLSPAPAFSVKAWDVDPCHPSPRN